MVYLIITLIYSTLPFLFQVIAIMMDLPTSAFAISVLVLSFAAMMLYGYFIFRLFKKWNRADMLPASTAGIYFPVFLPLIWYLLCSGAFNVFGLSSDRFAQALHGFLSLNLFGASIMIPSVEMEIQDKLFGLSQWHALLLINLFYYCIIILGFAVGERLAAHKMSMKRPFLGRHKKLTAAFVVLSVFVLSFYVFSEFSLYEQRKNIVESAHPSYNFPYAGGYSSIDLRPYNVENQENILAKLEETSTFIISDPGEMPIMDGAEAAYPVYSAFANACYENIAAIQKEAGKRESDTVMPVQFSNTIYAYEKLLTGEVDIFFGARPSEKQMEMARDTGVELALTPIGREAFVFFVNADNPIDSLSSEQLRDIYSGKIDNWREVGGKNQRILAFQRPENSGSQTMMQYFMGDTPLREPLETEYEASMGGVVRSVAEYENRISSLGYSFRYYTTIMMNDADPDGETTGIKLLAVDGVYPDENTIQSEEYPYTTQLYAITVVSYADGEDTKETILPFLDWMIGPQGQKIVEDTGYVALESGGLYK